MVSATAASYHLLVSSPDTTGGVGFLVHTSVAAKPPDLTTHIPGRLISCDLLLHEDLAALPTTVACFYGSELAQERRYHSMALEQLLSKPCLIMGDFNATTLPGDATTTTTNNWPWLQAKEASSALIDMV